MTDIFDEVDRRLSEDANSYQTREIWRAISDAFDEGGADAVSRALKRVWKDKVAEFDDACSEVEQMM